MLNTLEMKTLLLTLGLTIGFLTAGATIIKYAGPATSGDGSGSSITNTADFLDDKFWAAVQTFLKKEAVTVKFSPGDYLRAYTEKPLILDKIGNAKNLLSLEGVAQQTLFTVPNGYAKKAVIIEVRNSENITIRNFSFSGSGSLGYALRITSTTGNATKNIRVEDCSWTDMRGIIFGTTGAHQKGTSNITYKNCTFKRVGVDSHSHFMYHAYHSSHINVLDCYFEDCTGDYVRFRANCDYGTVKGSTFVRNKEFPVYPFISIPLFNNIAPGDEIFATHYAFTGNSFKNTKNAIAFHHYGFDPAGYHYLLTAAEGNALTTGTDEQKKNILLNNFKINLEEVTISNNNYSDVTSHLVVGSFPTYGAVTQGWKGWADISSLIK
jgi:hypothetical protein